MGEILIMDFSNMGPFPSINQHNFGDDKRILPLMNSRMAAKTNVGGPTSHAHWIMVRFNLPAWTINSIWFPGSVVLVDVACIMWSRTPGSQGYKHHLGRRPCHVAGWMGLTSARCSILTTVAMERKSRIIGKSSWNLLYDHSIYLFT